MATVITTQPTNSSIIDVDKNLQENLISSNLEHNLSKLNGDTKEDTDQLTAVVSEETVHLNCHANEEEIRKLRDELEKTRSQEQARHFYYDCCYIYDGDGVDDVCCFWHCISSCFRSMGHCADGCCKSCGHCICSCDSGNVAVGDNVDGDGCDCDDCDCGGCDCGDCDCGDCSCEDCADCCLCFSGLLECCKD